MDIRDDKFNYKGRLFPKYRFEEVDGQEIAVPTKEWKEHLNLLEVKRYLLSADVGEVTPYGLDTYIGEDRFNNIQKIKKYCAEFRANFLHVHLYFWSRINGTQKSTCAKDIIVRLVKQGVKSKFVLMDRLIKTLLDAERDDEAKQKAREWSAAEFLVIDECFSKGQITLFKSGYQLAFLNTFLKERLEVFRRATCFTANVSVEDIGQEWGSSIQSLIDRSIPTPMLFNDTVAKTSFRNDDIWNGV
ncbi:MAG: hypothetical protein LBE13_10480 [Bacteroidales bacterium]|nr:hypothetical protein [Bacteroidales bacterium]